MKTKLIRPYIVSSCSVLKKSSFQQPSRQKWWRDLIKNLNNEESAPNIFLHSCGGNVVEEIFQKHWLTGIA